jgi:hypothetical protein
MNQYRKKPVVIEAVQWQGGDADGIISWVGQQQIRFAGTGDSKLVIDTLEGPITASVGDWIIKGVKGEFYPCKPDIFDATYELVS